MLINLLTLNLVSAIVCMAAFSFSAKAQQKKKQPNFIIIFADDLGYGDLSCYGHPTIKTPNLDKMTAEGMKFTQFYVAANVCTPSRAALLTGRLPVRNGMTGGSTVLFPNSAGGLPSSEVTIAEVLKEKGYQTAIIGKWHLGHLPQFLPAKQGFDYYFGIPYSNDMNGGKYPPLPLIKNEKTIEENPDQTTLTKRYTDEVINFIKNNRDKPFFLYYPNNFPHVPLFASKGFKGKSKRGLYGDVVEELDWSVGQILKTLKDLKIDNNTLVIFTSDNGPWLTQKEQGGSAGLLFEGKGSSWEGGTRVPMIARWSGVIKPNQTTAALATTMDLLPTIVKFSGAKLPSQELDGQDISAILKGEKENVRELVYYYSGTHLYAIRKGLWKAHFTTKSLYSKEPAAPHNPPLLFNLENDPSEKYDVSKKHPEMVEEMKKEFDRHTANMKVGPSNMEEKIK